jgi:hypothetical protein
VTAKNKVRVETVNVPGYSSRVDAEKYDAMRKALLKVIPKKSSGISQKEMFEAVIPHLPKALWPGGEKVGWWAKTVQLDLEAKGLVKRTDTKPLKWYRA